MSTGAIEWKNKVWGKTRLVSKNQKFQLHEIRVEHKGAFCSWHTHIYRDNSFTLLSGSIRIVMGVLTEEGVMQLRSITLSDSNRGITHCTVPAGVLHQFQVVTPGTVLELYTPSLALVSCGVIIDEISEEDIIRFHEGGLCHDYDFSRPAEILYSGCFDRSRSGR